MAVTVTRNPLASSRMRVAIIRAGSFLGWSGAKRGGANGPGEQRTVRDSDRDSDKVKVPPPGAASAVRDEAPGKAWRYGCATAGRGVAPRRMNNHRAVPGDHLTVKARCRRRARLPSSPQPRQNSSAGRVTAERRRRAMCSAVGGLGIPPSSPPSPAASAAASLFGYF